MPASVHEIAAVELAEPIHDEPHGEPDDAVDDAGGEDLLEESLRGQFFWSAPPFSDVLFMNDIAQARDVLAGERNFLSSVRTAIYALLAATAILGIGSQNLPKGWADWVLCALLLLVGVAIPVFSLLNYAHAFDSWQRDVAAVHTTHAFTACVLFTAVVAILIIVREYSGLRP